MQKISHKLLDIPTSNSLPLILISRMIDSLIRNLY